MRMNNTLETLKESNCPLIETILRAADSALEKAGPWSRREDCAVAFYHALAETELTHELMVWLPERMQGFELNCGAYLDAVVEQELGVLFSADAQISRKDKDDLIAALDAAGLQRGIVLCFGECPGAGNTRWVLCNRSAGREAICGQETLA